VTFTLARVSKEKGYCCPEFDRGDSGAVEAHGLRHPLIEQSLSNVEYVKHDISLGYENCSLGWLVYGMNASGKSSLMKALGISVLLAQCGTFVPASQFRLRPFHSIFTRILNHDNLWAGLSSFTVEMTELREILKRADKRSLVLGDELCSGTESVSATSLVAAGLEWLTQKQSCFIFATHLHGLLALDTISKLSSLQIWHLRVRYDVAKDKLIYDRTLHRGPGSSLYGLEVAKALNLPLEFIEKAQAFRHQLLGTTTDEGSVSSLYNSNVFKKECEVCKCGITSLLEVHHIRPQKEANSSGHFEDGTHKNMRENLVVVCQTCHDKHHNSEIHIGKVKKTSDGDEREIQVVVGNPKEKAKSKWTEEEMNTILQVIREKPYATAEYIRCKLQEINITISDVHIRKLRKRLTQTE
jgi:DNA mismatch repair protein MutS